METNVNKTNKSSFAVSLANELKSVFLDKRFRIILIASYIAAFICYFEFLRINHGNGDWLNEGYLVYSNAYWHISLGRWLVRAVNLLTLNSVMPVFNVFFCTFCQSVSSVLLVRLWGIESKSFCVLTALSIVLAPAVATQYLYIHVAMTFGVALLLSVLSSYISLKNDGLSFQVLSAVLLCCSLGCYQSYIGFTAGIIVLTLLLWIGRENSLTIGKKVYSSLIMGVGGSALYVAIWKITQMVFGVETSPYSGADHISPINVFANLGGTIRTAYSDCLAYYGDPIAYRCFIFVPIILIFVFLVVLSKRRILKDCRSMIAVAVLVLILPLAFNFVDIIASERNISTIMSHQMQLIIPFTFALADATTQKPFIKRLTSLSACLLTSALCVVFLVCAFSTYKTIDLSYRYVETVSGTAISRVMNDENYDDSRIMFAGFPDETEIHLANPLFKWSYHKLSGVFWTELDCQKIWQQFTLNTFGINTGIFSNNEYQEVVNSNFFVDMGIYPARDSIKKYNDFYVVKFMEYPPR